MKHLPPELKPFVPFLNDLPKPDKAVFLYRVCLLLCRAGRMRAADWAAGDDYEVIYFETGSGVRFPVAGPDFDRVTHLEIMKRIKPMLDEAEKMVEGL